jgi:competence protein ComEC
VAWQHVIGSFRVDWLGDVTSGGPLARASNRVRSLVADGAALIGEPDDSLLRGLVIGDDLDQPPEMIERLRRSGLSHLTAVSGQNVTLVLAAGAPLLRRLGSRTRLVTTVALIAWFVAITRFEPSILRAGTMAVLATVGTHLGRERTPMRMLALALSLLVVIDPLITRSVGLWLSVGATAGVVGLGPRLAEGLGRFGVLATPVGITLGAQLGVALPSVLTFGRLPLVGLVANLLAVPVAGAVMLLGLPACLIAGALGGISPDLGWLALAPVALGVRWVDQISIIGDRIEPESSVYGIVVTLAVGVAAQYRFEWRRRRGVPEMAGVL